MATTISKRTGAALAATCLVLAGCKGSNGSDRSFFVTVNRPAEEVMAALKFAATDLPADSFLADTMGGHLQVKQSGQSHIVFVVPGDRSADDIHYTIDLTGSGAGTKLSVNTDIPSKAFSSRNGTTAGTGDGYASNLRHEFFAMGQDLDAGKPPRDAGNSLRMALHLLANSNRGKGRENWARISADPNGYAREKGRQAADDFIESQNLPPEKEQQMKDQVHGALDKSQSGEREVASDWSGPAS